MCWGLMGGGGTWNAIHLYAVMAEWEKMRQTSNSKKSVRALALLVFHDGKIERDEK